MTRRNNKTLYECTSASITDVLCKLPSHGMAGVLGIAQQSSCGLSITGQSMVGVVSKTAARMWIERCLPGIDNMLLPVDLVVIHDQRECSNVTNSIDIRIAGLQLAVHLQPATHSIALPAV